MRIELIETELPEHVVMGSGVPRSGGLHLTQIIIDVAFELGFVNKMTSLGDSKNLMFEMGFNWERIIEGAWADRTVGRPGELSLDGITGSPDDIGTDADGLYLEEYKCTWKSCRKLKMEEQWYWLTQAKGYCKMCDLDRVMFRVLFVNGDYGPRFPQYRGYMIWFTQDEIDENWQMLVNHAKSKGWL